MPQYISGSQQEFGGIRISRISKPVTFGKLLCRYIKSEGHRQLQVLSHGKHRADFRVEGVV